MCCSFQDKADDCLSPVCFTRVHMCPCCVLSRPNPMPPRDSKSCMESAQGWGLHQVCEPGQMVGGSHPWRPVEASTGARWAAEDFYLKGAETH